MSLFDLPRVPEAEVMDDSSEVEAYSLRSRASIPRQNRRYFRRTRVCASLKGKERGRALDIGTGPGQIVLKLARRLKLWKFVGVDRSANMIAQARSNLAAASGSRRPRRISQSRTEIDLPSPMPRSTW